MCVCVCVSVCVCVFEFVYINKYVSRVSVFNFCSHSLYNPALGQSADAIVWNSSRIETDISMELKKSPVIVICY